MDDRFHVSRRLGRTIRSGRFTCTIDRAFADVMRLCGDRAEGNWINDDFRAAYGRLHELGHAHSVEAWTSDRGMGVPPMADESPTGETPVPLLAGGVYGVALGGAFFAESMCHRVTDAGKVALVKLVEHLRSRGFALCDVQWLTEHLETFGACELPRAEYMSLLATALAAPATFR